MTIRADFSSPLFYQDPSFADANYYVMYEAFNYLMQLGRGISNNQSEIKWMYSELEHPLFNYIYNINVNDEEFSIKAHKIINIFREKHTPFLWFNASFMQSKNCRNILEKEGLEYVGPMKGMVYELHDLPHVEIEVADREVQKVDTTKRLELFDQVSAVVFNHPFGFAYKFFKNIFISPYLSAHLELFISVNVAGEPLGIGVLFLGKNAAVNFWEGVIPSARQQGVLTQLTFHRMRRARAYGYSQIHCPCLPPYVGIYRRLGFQECCAFELFSYTPA